MVDDTPAPAAPAPAAARRRRGFWTVLVPVVTAGAGILFAMSFQAAQGSDLRADRDLPQQIVAGDALVSARADQLDALQKEVIALSSANSPNDTRLRELLAQTLHRPTFLAAHAERAVSRALGGSCSMPLAAHAVWEGDSLRLDAALGDAARADRTRPGARGPRGRHEGVGAGHRGIAERLRPPPRLLAGQLHGR